MEIENRFLNLCLGRVLRQRTFDFGIRRLLSSLVHRMLISRFALAQLYPKGKQNGMKFCGGEAGLTAAVARGAKRTVE